MTLNSMLSNEYTDGGETNRLAKVAIGALIGATLGALAGALAMKNTAHNVKTVKNVGYVFKMQLLVLTKM